MYDPNQLDNYSTRELNDQEKLRLTELSDEKEVVQEESAVVPPQGQPQPQAGQPQPQVGPPQPQAPTQQPQQPVQPQQPAQPQQSGNALQTTAEAALAVPTGVVDWTVDAINQIPGVDIPKIPEFENQITQAAREFSGVVVPTVGLTVLSKGKIKGLTSKLPVGGKAAKFVNDPLTKFIGGASLDLGVGAAVDVVYKPNEEDDNLAGTLKKMWPRSTGWIPDDIATLDSDSPLLKKQKNVVEGMGIGGGLSILEGGVKLLKALRGVGDANKMWVPSNEQAGYYGDTEKSREWLEANSSKVDTPDEAVAQAEMKTSQALDEEGAVNLAENKDPDKPLIGVHDVFGPREVGTRTVDDFGVVGAGTDVSRMKRDPNLPAGGAVGSVMSEGAIKAVNAASSDVRATETVSRAMANVIKEAGPVGYGNITAQNIIDDGIELASEFQGLNVKQLAEKIEPLLQNVDQYGTKQLDDTTYVAVFENIKKDLADFADMDVQRAQAYIAKSMSDQVSNIAEGARLMEGTDAVNRAEELILDRMEYLMTLKGQTSYSRGRALNMLNLWDRMTVKGSKAAMKGAKTMKKAQVAEAKKLVKDDSTQTLKALERIKNESKTTIDSLRAVKAEKPEMLAPFMLGYELTNGDINSIAKLNRYFANSTGVFKKAFLDSNPQQSSAYMKAWWSNIYNSTLSAIGTPIKAGVSNALLIAERPIATFAGGIMGRDQEVLRRGWYQYSAAQETLQKGLSYMKTVWTKSGLDPTVISAREGITSKEADKMELLKTFADAKAQKGEFGPQAMVSIIEESQQMADHPWLRFGTRSMQAFDGFTQAVIGNIEARGRAFDRVTNGGLKAVNADRANAIAKQTYDQMFDESGLLTDEAAKYAAGEIAFNLDNEANTALSNMINRAPIIKPFLLFTKTPLNALAYTGSHNPLALFIGDFNKFQLPFDKMNRFEVEELLDARGIKYNETNIKAEYNTIRAEMNGRKAIGMLTVTAAASLFMNDNITGNGLADKTKQRGRREYNWKPRSIKNPLNGEWTSYDNLGAISDWFALTVDIMDNGLDFDVTGKGGLRPADIGENMRAMGFVVAASLTDKTFLAGLEPMTDVARGDVGAMNRWASTFLTSAAVPGSSLMAEFSRLMYPQLRVVDNNMKSLIQNRTPFKGALPVQYDWIDGGPVNEPINLWTRVANTYLPWKTNGKITAEKQFLIDVGYDGVPSLKTDGRGQEYTDKERSELTSLMGEQGIFKEQLKMIMKGKEAARFRKEFKQAQKDGGEFQPKLNDFAGLHTRIDYALNIAKKAAETRLSTRDEVFKKSYQNRVMNEYYQRGDTDGAINQLRQFGKN